MSLKMALSIPLADILAYRWEGGSAFCGCTCRLCACSLSTCKPATIQRSLSRVLCAHGRPCCSGVPSCPTAHTRPWPNLPGRSPTGWVAGRWARRTLRCWTCCATTTPTSSPPATRVRLQLAPGCYALVAMPGPMLVCQPLLWLVEPSAVLGVWADQRCLLTPRPPPLPRVACSHVCLPAEQPRRGAQVAGRVHLVTGARPFLAI